jgi:hypothetical protein
MEAAWIAVIASLGGVTVGGLLNVASDELRWRREQRHALAQIGAARAEQLRQSCIDLASVADEVRSRAWSFADYRLQDPSGWRTDAYVQSQQDKLEDAIGRFDRLGNVLEFAGTPNFWKETSALLTVVRDGVAAVFSDEPDHPSDHGPTCSAFLKAAAKSLGPGNASADPPTPGGASALIKRFMSLIRR